jgi:mono/diheme cytochrome c family protein
MRCRRRRLWPARAGRLALAVVAGVSIATLLSDRSEVAGFQEPVEDSVAGRGADRGELVSQYCVGCHNERLLTGGLSLAAVAPAIDHSNAATWEKVVRKVRIGAMPPPGLPRPEAAAFEEFVVSLEADLDTLSEREPNPGRPLLRRVNRTEYGNAIRDLLDLDVDIATLLPPDDSAYGFDNIADVLVLSPVLVER